MKLEVGMYVRFNYNRVTTPIRIAKIIYKYYEKSEKSYCYLTDEGLVIGENNLIKEPSFSITDLIEAGDYVNGQKVYYDEELNFLYVQSFDADGEFYQESITKQSFIDNIKSIVTKEQFEQMEYKVGEIND